MLNMFQLADMDACGGLLPVVRMLRKVIWYIQILVPIGLLLYGSIDLGKAVIASDEKEVKAAQTRLIKRVIYAVVVFLVPMLVTLVMNIVAGSGAGDSDTATWQNCWKASNSQIVITRK